MYYKIKQKFKINLAKYVNSLGYKINKIEECQFEIYKINKINDPIKRIYLQKEFLKKHQELPIAHYEYAMSLWLLRDSNLFEQLDQYAKVKEKWLENTIFHKLDIEFIDPGIFTGSLGNYHVYMPLLRANEFGLRKQKDHYVLLRKSALLRNPAYFKYFKPHLNVVEDDEVIQQMESLESILTLPNFFMTFNNHAEILDIAENILEAKRIELNLKKKIFRLREEDEVKGKEVLKKLGLPNDAWYVTVHVREPTFRGESYKNTSEKFRSANPMDYLKSMNAITKAGGWVFRMGDPSMKKLPPAPQVIDYAHHKIRSEWMDVFLGATCRFCISTSSGYYTIPMSFGVPILATNFLYYLPYYSFTEQDLFLPRLLVDKNKQALNMEDCMTPPNSMHFNDHHYFESGISWVENTPEELEAATLEMLKRTDSDLSRLPSDDALQLRFKSLAETCGLKYGGRRVKAFASISSDFLEQHADLL